MELSAFNNPALTQVLITLAAILIGLVIITIATLNGLRSYYKNNRYNKHQVFLIRLPKEKPEDGKTESGPQQLREEISKGSSINLFMRIIAINYCYDMRIHPQFMSSLFLFSDLADEKTYYCIKEFVIMYQKNYCTNKTTFMLNHFQLHYSSLMTFVFSPSNISHGSVELVKSIIDTKDQEFFDFIGLILIKLKYGAWEQKKGGGRISLFTPRKKIKEMNYDFSILDCRKLRYIDEFLNESLQRERISDLFNIN